MDGKEQKVSMCEEIVDAIGRFPRPVGAILIGADGEFKNSVIGKLKCNCSDLEVFYTYPPNPQLVCGVMMRSGIGLIVLDSATSVSHKVRHQLVGILRGFGAKTVVGIYTQAKLPQPVNADSNLSMSHETALFSQTIECLKKYPPTADGLEQLFIYEEGGEDDE